MKFAIASALLLAASQAVSAAPQLDENDWLIMMDRQFCDGNKWNERGNDQRDAMQMLLRHNERQTDLVFTGPSFAKDVIARLKGRQGTLDFVDTEFKLEVRTGTFGDDEALILEDVEPTAILSMQLASALVITVGSTQIRPFELKGSEPAIDRFILCHFVAPQAAVIEDFDFSKF